MAEDEVDNPLSPFGEDMMNCTICGTELKNGLDTFGDVGSEVCQQCWIHPPDEGKRDTWYGLAPHTYFIDAEGRFTEVLLDVMPDGSGYIEIEPGLIFIPDVEVNGAMGVWEDSRPSRPEPVIIPDDQLPLFAAGQ